MANATPGRRPSWVDGEVFPFESRFVDVGGNQVHYVDEGDGPTLLMCHGNPTWSFLYRHVIAGLSDDFRCVAFDLPGFGLSSARDGYGFTYSEHTDVAAGLVEALDLRGVTLFVQDWGGPIGLGAATRQPERYEALVIANTFAWPVDQFSWRAMSRVLGGPVGRWFVGRTNMLAKSVARSHKRTPLTANEAEHYTAPYPDPMSRTPHHVFLRQLTAARPQLQDLERSLPAVSELPTLVLWGDEDAFYKEPAHNRISSLFPNHRTHVLEGVGHFIQDDAGDEVAAIIKEWWPRTAP